MTCTQSHLCDIVLRIFPSGVGVVESAIFSSSFNKNASSVFENVRAESEEGKTERHSDHKSDSAITSAIKKKETKKTPSLNNARFIHKSHQYDSKFPFFPREGKGRWELERGEGEG